MNSQPGNKLCRKDRNACIPQKEGNEGERKRQRPDIVSDKQNSY